MYLQSNILFLSITIIITSYEEHCIIFYVIVLYIGCYGQLKVSTTLTKNYNEKYVTIRKKIYSSQKQMYVTNKFKNHDKCIRNN